MRQNFASSKTHRLSLPYEEALTTSQMASALALILAIRETKSRLFLSMKITSSAQ